MDINEEKVKNYLESMGFTVECFSKAELRGGDKTPDFRISRNGNFLFYCEVKSSPIDHWLVEQLQDALVDGSKNDPIFNRLTKDISEAAKQFDAVNSDSQVPNVLALVNHDDMCGFNDLLAILTGNYYSDDGSVHPIYKKFSEGRIKNDKTKIHLIIWLDDFKPYRLWFSQTNNELQLKLCEWFDINPNDINVLN